MVKRVARAMRPTCGVRTTVRDGRPTTPSCAAGLRGMPLYISSGGGIPGRYDNPHHVTKTKTLADQIVIGGVLEGGSMYCTQNLPAGSKSCGSRDGRPTADRIAFLALLAGPAPPLRGRSAERHLRWNPLHGAPRRHRPTRGSGHFACTPAAPVLGGSAPTVEVRARSRAIAAAYRPPLGPTPRWSRHSHRHSSPVSTHSNFSRYATANSGTFVLSVKGWPRSIATTSYAAMASVRKMPELRKRGSTTAWATSIASGRTGCCSAVLRSIWNRRAISRVRFHKFGQERQLIVGRGRRRLSGMIEHQQSHQSAVGVRMPYAAAPPHASASSARPPSAMPHPTWRHRRANGERQFRDRDRHQFNGLHQTHPEPADDSVRRRRPILQSQTRLARRQLSR